MKNEITTPEHKFRDYFFNTKRSDSLVFTIFRDEMNFEEKNRTYKKFILLKNRDTEYGFLGNCFPKEVKDVYRFPLSKRPSSKLNNVLAQCYYSILTYRSPLDTFFKMKQEYDNFLYESLYEKAFNQLKVIQKEIGFSVWLLDQLAFLSKKNNAASEMFNSEIEIFEKNKESVIRVHIATFLKDKYGDDSSLMAHVKQLESALETTTGSSIGRTSTYSILKLLLFPSFNIVSRDEVLRGLWVAESFSIIDRFFVFEKSLFFLKRVRFNFTDYFQPPLKINIASPRLNNIINILECRDLCWDHVAQKLEKELGTILNLEHKICDDNSLCKVADQEKYCLSEILLGDILKDSKKLSHCVYLYRCQCFDVFPFIETFFINAIGSIHCWNLIQNDFILISLFKNKAFQEKKLLSIFLEINKTSPSDLIEFRCESPFLELIAAKKVFSELGLENRTSKLTEFLLKIYNERRYLLDYLPIKDFLDESIKLKQKDHLKHIIFPLLASYVEESRQGDVDWNFIYSFTDLFLYQNKVGIPSELISSLNTCNQRLLFDFFEKSCSLNVLSFLRKIKNEEERISERVRLVSFLLEQQEYLDREDIKQEFYELLKEITLRNDVHDISHGLIYIDFDQLQRLLRHTCDKYVSFYNNTPDELISQIELESLAEQYFALDTPEDINEKSSENIVEKTHTPALDKKKISLKFYCYKSLLKVLFHNFSYHTLYGLDPFLCVRIRHGYFRTTVKSVLATNDLVSKSGGDLFCGNNEMQTISYLTQNAKKAQQIEKALSEFITEFSKHVDNIKSKLLHIQSFSQPLGLLDCSVPDVEIENEYAIFEKNSETNFDTFFISARKLFISKLNSSLLVAKKYFEDDFLEKSNEILNGLSQKTRSVDKDGALAARINKCRTDFDSNGAQISRWFDWADNDHFEDFYISSLFDACFKSLKVVFEKSNIKLEIINDIKDMEIKLSGRNKKNFADVINNLLLNAEKYSASQQTNLTVTVIIDFKDKCQIVKIQNPITGDREALNTAVDKAKNKCMNLSVESFDMRGEGGTGLIKAKRIIEHHIGHDCHFDFNIIEHNFVATIKIPGAK